MNAAHECFPHRSQINTATKSNNSAEKCKGRGRGESVVIFYLPWTFTTLAFCFFACFVESRLRKHQYRVHCSCVCVVVADLFSSFCVNISDLANQSSRERMLLDNDLMGSRRGSQVKTVRCFRLPVPKRWSVLVSSQRSKASVCQLAHKASGDGPVSGTVLCGPKQVQSPVEAQLQKGLQWRGQ